MKYPWTIYPNAVYWTLPDDGALFKCTDCEEDKPHTEVYLTQVPDGNRATICKDCIDEYWLSIAENKGKFKD